MAVISFPALCGYHCVGPRDQRDLLGGLRAERQTVIGAADILESYREVFVLELRRRYLRNLNSVEVIEGTVLDGDDIANAKLASRDRRGGAYCASNLHGFRSQRFRVLPCEPQAIHEGLAVPEKLRGSVHAPCLCRDFAAVVRHFGAPLCFTNIIIQQSLNGVKQNINDLLNIFEYSMNTVQQMIDDT